MKIPDHAKINSYIQGADFYDCHCQKIKYTSQSALEIYLETMKETPKWVDTLMVLRNRVFTKLGLKDLGKISNLQTLKQAQSYQEGEVVGIFSIYEISQNEIILEDKDNHLNVKISFLIEQIESSGLANVYATTVVHNKNLLGRTYMFFVEPMHKLIVPAVLRTLI